MYVKENTLISSTRTPKSCNLGYRIWVCAMIFFSLTLLLLFGKLVSTITHSLIPVRTEEQEIQRLVARASIPVVGVFFLMAMSKKNFELYNKSKQIKDRVDRRLLGLHRGDYFLKQTLPPGSLTFLSSNLKCKLEGVKALQALSYVWLLPFSPTMIHALFGWWKVAPLWLKFIAWPVAIMMPFVLFSMWILSCVLTFFASLFLFFWVTVMYSDFDVSMRYIEDIPQLVLGLLFDTMVESSPKGILTACVGGVLLVKHFVVDILLTVRSIRSNDDKAKDEDPSATIACLPIKDLHTLYGDLTVWQGLYLGLISPWITISFCITLFFSLPPYLRFIRGKQQPNKTTIEFTQA